MDPQLLQLAEVTRVAGLKTVEYFGTKLDIQYKEDHSPLTQADLASHRILAAALQDLSPDLPVISEESPVPPYPQRQLSPEFWIIDPLDGTKEFVKAIPEYTVNVALIKDGRPVLGVVGVPASGVLYAAKSGAGSFRFEPDRGWTPLPKTVSVDPGEKIRFITSRSHIGPVELELIRHLEGEDPIRAGSAFKFCLVAEGKGDAYLRHKPIMEWDTAAGDLVLSECGGLALEWDGSVLGYNKPEVRHRGLIAGATHDLARFLHEKARQLKLTRPD